VDEVDWGEPEPAHTVAGWASAVTWGVIGALVAGGLVLSGILEVYVRELEPYSYAERGAVVTVVLVGRAAGSVNR
jgi:hypothetical protein